MFTDVEGSTRRWEADADEMRIALAAHDEVLRGAIEGHGEFGAPGNRVAWHLRGGSRAGGLKNGCGARKGGPPDSLRAPRSPSRDLALRLRQLHAHPPRR